MARQLQPAGADQGTQNKLEDADFNTSKTLQQGEFVTVASIQADRTNWNAWGLGVRNRQYANGYFYADLKTSPDGGTTVNDANGKARFVVYSDSRMEQLKAIGPTFNLQTLREAATEKRTDRPVLPLLSPGAKTDQFIALQIRTDNSTNDGEPIYLGSSDYHVPYSEIAANR